MTTDPAACDHIYATQAKLPHRYCWRCGLSEEEIMKHEMNKQAAAIVETEKQKLVKPTSDPAAMPELLPCPFCGGDSFHIKYHDDNSREDEIPIGDFWAITCNKCGTFKTGKDAEYASAISAWNTRPPHSDTKGVGVEAIKADAVANVHTSDIVLHRKNVEAVINYLHAQGYLRGQDAPPAVDLDEHKQALWMVDTLLKDSIPINVIEKVVGILEWIADNDRMRYMRYGDSAPKNVTEMQAKAKIALAALAPYRKAGG